RRMLYVDCHTWLADNLLERGDRMSMAASIENRPPFLDHELVELAFRVDSSLKVRNGRGKWIVREMARRLLPAAIVDRKKVGFRVPLDEWFRGGLRDYVHDLLLARDGFVAGYFARPGVGRPPAGPRAHPPQRGAAAGDPARPRSVLAPLPRAAGAGHQRARSDPSLSPPPACSVRGAVRRGGLDSFAFSGSDRQSR